MDGLYLYCIRGKTESAPAISAEGIGGGEVFAFNRGRLEAVVSRVSLKEFGSGEVRKKAQEDLVWIREKALLHQKTIEAAAAANGGREGLIPMRFGIIFNGDKNLETLLDKDSARITEKLEKLRGKREWGLKVYLTSRKSFKQGVKEKSALIRGKLKALAELPEGAAFFAEEELEELISAETDKELDGFALGVFEAFKKFAAESVKNKNLGKEVTGKAEPMVLNAAYLIPGENVAGFKAAAEKENKKILEKGFYLEYSGPWPAYNFAAY